MKVYRGYAIGLILAVATLGGCTTAPVESSLGSGTGGQQGSLAGRDGRSVIGTSDEALGSNDRVWFALDSAALDQRGLEIVEQMSQSLRGQPQVRVTIEGHADERGTREYNLALGERRAVALRNALVDRGLAATRIVATISYGKERPAVAGSSEAAWAQNRRAVVVFD